MKIEVTIVILSAAAGMLALAAFWTDTRLVQVEHRLDRLETYDPCGQGVAVMSADGKSMITVCAAASAWRPR